jgi:hypothetical protein
MAPWLADRMWLQVLLLSVYLFGFTATGTWIAREPARPGEDRAEASVAAVVFGLMWPVLAVIGLPLGLCWLLGQLLGAGGERQISR